MLLFTLFFSLSTSLHVLYIFFHETIYIWLDEWVLELFDGKPSKSKESFGFAGYGIFGAVIFHEKKINIFFYNRIPFLVTRDITVVDFRHELDDFKFLDIKIGFFADFSEGCIFGSFFSFHLSFRYDENSFTSCIFPF